MNSFSNIDKFNTSFISGAALFLMKDNIIYNQDNKKNSWSEKKEYIINVTNYI